MNPIQTHLWQQTSLNRWEWIGPDGTFSCVMRTEHGDWTDCTDGVYSLNLYPSAWACMEAVESRYMEAVNAD